MRKPIWMIAALCILAAFVITGSYDSVVQGSQANEEAIRAKAAIEAALAKDPRNSQLWVYLGFAERNVQEIEKAQDAFEKAVSLNPRNVPANFMLGLIYEKKKLYDKAKDCWEVCLKNSPEERMKEIARKHLSLLEKNP